LVTTLCYLLFTPDKRRYLLIFNFCFGSAFLTLLLLSFRSCQKREVNEDAPVDTIPDTDLGEVVDAEVAKIAIEKQSNSGGFGGTNAIREGSSDDADEEKRVEV
jgi:hypothetical protein